MGMLTLVKFCSKMSAPTRLQLPLDGLPPWFQEGHTLCCGWCVCSVMARLLRASVRGYLTSPLRRGSDQLGDLGSGAGKGGGSGGSIREAGGAFGKKQAADEERYFKQKEKEQLAALKNHHEEEIDHHKKEIERLQREIDRHKGKIRKLKHDD